MKKSIRFALSLFLVALITLIAVQLNIRHNKYSAIQKLPNIELMTIDGTLIKLHELNLKNKIFLIFLFHPECEFCLMELQDIILNKDELSSIDLLIVSTATIGEIKDLFNDYPLDSINNVVIASDYKGEFCEIFKIKSPPVWFIYSDNELIKSFKGTMSIKNILQFTK
ncbi:peroxiredoxin [Bacteroides sp. 51]|uniref:peroxiredoxin family protein n=1 Tax=Bacteroides sp. 51 TaxID=2302938 RepID=UPI0013D030C6|nr:redoxin domain-containing protein [Bacteroides sp. 51]